MEKENVRVHFLRKGIKYILDKKWNQNNIIGFLDYLLLELFLLVAAILNLKTMLKKKNSKTMKLKSQKLSKKMVKLNQWFLLTILLI